MKFSPLHICIAEVKTIRHLRTALLVLRKEASNL